MVAEWTKNHPGETPPSAVIREWASLSPDNPTVKSLYTELENQQKQQTLNQQRIQQKQQANIPLTAEDIAILNQKPEGQPRNVPSVLEPSKEGAQTKLVEEKKVDGTNLPPVNKNIYITPNGARVTEDVYKDFYKNGKTDLPIISNIRTQEEQDALRDPNNPGFTKQGLPVAKGLGKHGTGDALDIDTKKLTDDQRKMLESKGWHQPSWATDPNSKQYDPNHWERDTAKPAEETKPVVKPVEAKKEEGGYYPHTVPLPKTAGLGDKDREAIMAGHKDRATAAESSFATMVNNQGPLFTNGSPNYNRMQNNYKSTTDLIENNPEIAKKIFRMVAQQGPLANALNEGLGIHAGNFTANVNLPVEAWTAGGLSETQASVANKIMAGLIGIQMGNMQQQGIDPTKVPAGEYMKALSQFVHKDMTPLEAANLLHKQQAEFDHQKENYDQIMKERSTRVDPNSSTPYADIHNNSQELKRIGRKYKAIVDSYDAEYQKKIDELKKKEKEKKGGKS
jgi:hypothetical protein